MILPLSRIDDVERVLERLPVLEGKRSEIQTSALAIYGAYVIYGFTDEYSYKRSSGTKRGLRELEDFREQLLSLHESYQNLHAEAFDALVTEVVKSQKFKEKIEISDVSVEIGGIPHPKLFDIDVRGMIKQVDAAHERLLSNSEVTKGSTLRKNAAAGVARCAISVFEDLTGKNVTRTTDPMSHKARGPVLELIRGLFLALNIKASPESQLRNAINSRADSVMEKRSAKLVP